MCSLQYQLLNSQNTHILYNGTHETMVHIHERYIRTMRHIGTHNGTHEMHTYHDTHATHLLQWDTCYTLQLLLCSPKSITSPSPPSLSSSLSPSRSLSFWVSTTHISYNTCTHGTQTHTHATHTWYTCYTLATSILSL